MTVLAPTGELAADLQAPLVPIPPGLGARASFALARELRQAVARERADIIHVHHRRHALLAQAVTRGSSTLVVEHVHSSFRDKRALSFRADRVIAVGSRIQRDIVEHYRRPADKVFLVENAVHDPGERQDPTLHHGPDLRLVAVGRLDALKDPGFFDAMLGQMRARGHRVQAQWAGDGELRPRTTEWPNVEWLGQVPEPEVPELLRRANALVLTSTQEGLPLVALQALAVGTPVLARRAGSVADAVVECRTGAVWSETLTPADAVVWLEERGLLTTAKLQEMRASSRRHYEGNFTVDAMIEKLDRLYHQWVQR